MEIQEINIGNDVPKLNVSGGGTKSVNFGPGADLLMNQNKQKKGTGMEINDINEINIGGSLKDAQSSMFSDIKLPDDGFKINLDDKIDDSTNFIKKDILKEALKKEKSESNDGFKKFNDIPVNPNVVPPKEPKMSAKELLREKFKYLRLLESIEQKGASLSKKYTMDSHLDEMKGEYETLKNEKEKSNSVKFQGKMLMACVSGLEFLNGRFDPFDLKLDGWAEAVNENMEEYDDVFGELHEKYGSKAKMAPELKLLFMLGGSGVMLHMTNTMFKSAMPGMDDIMRQNPELMQQFTQAAASSMGESSPGLGGFMNMVSGGMSQMQPPRGNHQNDPPHGNPPRGSPPGPNEGMRIDPPQMNSNRPDIDMARSNVRANFNDAENMESNFASVNEKRKEMRGPSDLRDILSGLKTKKINLKEKKPGSTVSIGELNEMKNDMKQIKKSKRKHKSERNTISLDL
jgi:hypothetical protein